MAPFSKRLTCFYCGRRPAQSINGPIANFHCEYCDADNYLDKNGEITDPPAEVTNASVTSNMPFLISKFDPGRETSPETYAINETSLFCSQCLRNQHLYTVSIAAYFPEDEDIVNTEYDENYESYRREVEARYPQVCENCEPRVKQKIRQAGYDAKADHLRRMMERSRACKTMQRTRQRSWQSLVVYLGAIGFWMSIIGQLAWNISSALTLTSSIIDSDLSIDDDDTPVSFISCTAQLLETRRLPQACSFDLAPAAGVALVVGCLSLWYNPKLRMKILGRTGNFSGLVEYYEVQLIFMVVRGVFWSLFKDPAASGIDAQKSLVGHLFMILFTTICVLVSRRVIKYNIRPLVDWTDRSWETKPMRSPTSISAACSPALESMPRGRHGEIRQPFPFDKFKLELDAPKPQASPAFPTPPPDGPDGDDMEWSPSGAQQIQPTVSVQPVMKAPVYDEPNPFYGTLPPAPKPPAWGLRMQEPERRVAKVVESNPFHRTPTESRTTWQHKSASPQAVFQPPRFFPSSDYQNTTGLETMFDQAFSIEPDNSPARRRWADEQRPKTPHASGHHRLTFQAFRFLLLLCATGAWTFSQNHTSPIPGNYVETFALGSACLIAGLALLDVVKQPFADWKGLEILVNITELGVSVHLGSHMPQASFEREYFDRYGKLLLIFMAVQEGMGLLTSYRAALPSVKSKSDEDQQSVRAGSTFETPRIGQNGFAAQLYSPTESASSSPSIEQSFLTAPPLSFGSTAGSASFSSALPSVSNYRLSSGQNYQPMHQNYDHNPHSFTMKSLKEAEPSDYEQDSDSETVATTATAWTNATNRNIRYGRRLSAVSSTDNFFSPRRNELGPVLGSLSLDDRPSSRRMTRSQTQSGLKGRSLTSRTYR
ncbi:hypothetical protein N7488_001128 [Penicillium malachiteum]|nr:hypothetical protein N7488_001128 [Penicillium malachiteum]